MVLETIMGLRKWDTFFAKHEQFVTNHHTICGSQFDSVGGFANTGQDDIEQLNRKLGELSITHHVNNLSASFLPVSMDHFFTKPCRFSLH